MKPKTKHVGQAPAAMPSRREINDGCTDIQDGWSERVRDQRTVQKARPVEVLVIPVTRDIAEALHETI